VSEDAEKPTEPESEPSPDESPFELQPLDVQERGNNNPWETRDGD
jgi:hypothetical protein